MEGIWGRALFTYCRRSSRLRVLHMDTISMTDHETPALRTQSPRRAVIIACILILLSGLLWALVMWQLWSLVPQKKRIFDDFGMKLPMISEMVIDLSTWSMDFPFATAILCFFSILAALIGWICSTSYGIGADAQRYMRIRLHFPAFGCERRHCCEYVVARIQIVARLAALTLVLGSQFSFTLAATHSSLII